MAEDSVRRVNEILAVEPMEEVRSEAAEHVSDASVALRGVTFSYPGAAVPAVRDVTLEVPAGATVALVGPSGGGKSTLASLIPRFWDPQEGTVAVGGADVRAVPTAELMDTVAFVFQNDRLFKGTLADDGHGEGEPRPQRGVGRQLVAGRHGHEVAQHEPHEHERHDGEHAVECRERRAHISQAAPRSREFQQLRDGVARARLCFLQ